MNNTIQTPVSLKEKCRWTFDYDQSMYDTQCDNAFLFVDGARLDEHEFKYCPFCGGEISQVKT